MDRRTARDLARGHVARALRTNLNEGWPLAEQHGYTDAEQAMVAEEIDRITRRYEEVSNRPGLL